MNSDYIGTGQFDLARRKVTKFVTELETDTQSAIRERASKKLSRLQLPSSITDNPIIIPAIAVSAITIVLLIRKKKRKRRL